MTAVFEYDGLIIRMGLVVIYQLGHALPNQYLVLSLVFAEQDGLRRVTENRHDGTRQNCTKNKFFDTSASVIAIDYLLIKASIRNPGPA